MTAIRSGFSIGEISQLFGLSVQSLRHYDKLGLLKPAHVDPQSNYRYYSREQFLFIRFIRYFKALGMPLKHIQAVLTRDMSSEVILELVRNQSSAIDRKIAELVELRTAVNSFAERLSKVMTHQPGQVFAERRSERTMIAYDYAMGPANDLALGMRRVLMDVEKTHGFLTYEPGVLASYDDFAMNGIVRIKQIIVDFDNPIDASERSSAVDRTMTFPEGMYATVIYEDAFDAGPSYYSKLVQFMADAHLEAHSDFIHSMVASYVDAGGTGKSLHEVSVLVR